MVNLTGVFIAGIAGMAIGFLWYSKMLFGNTWAKLVGVKMNKKPEGMGKIFVFAFISTLVTAYVLGYFLEITSLTPTMLAFWLWLGFVATFTLGPVLWLKKSFKAYIIDNGHNVVALIVMALILAKWG
jgi:hypothetical protein